VAQRLKGKGHKNGKENAAGKAQIYYNLKPP